MYTYTDFRWTIVELQAKNLLEGMIFTKLLYVHQLGPNLKNVTKWVIK